MIPSALRLTGRQFNFQHSKDPKHMVVNCAILEENKIQVLEMAFAITSSQFNRNALD